MRSPGAIKVNDNRQCGVIARWRGRSMVGMSRREVAFLLIGLGLGLMLAVAEVIWLFVVWSHHMFIVGMRLSPGLALLGIPFLLLLVGVLLLYRSRSGTKSS